MLPPPPSYRSNPHTMSFFGGVLLGSYSRPSIPTNTDISYSVVARAWRLSQAPGRHQDVSAMSQLALNFGDPAKDLSPLTRNVQKLCVSPTMCIFLWRLLTNSLYLNMSLWGTRLVPSLCLCLGHTFNPAFHPTFSAHKC